MFYKVVFYVSRNKDNKEVENFKERKRAFLVTEENATLDKLRPRFMEFVNEGLPGEMSRLYVSVNKRSGDKVYTSLMHWLLDHPDTDLGKLEAKVAGLAAEVPCAAEHKWLLDVDTNDSDVLNRVLNEVDLRDTDHSIDKSVYRTAHGYAVVVSHGFDTRNFKETFAGLVEVKKDDMLLLEWAVKE